jgi:hypothetical protein
MRLGNAIRLLRQAGFRAYAYNTPEPGTAEIEVLVRHPVHGKCPAIRISSPERTRRCSIGR